MHGLLNIDKPAGVSSRHVVSQIELVLRPLAVGHAGTLDPLATGVLVVCVGRATKLVDYLHRFSKTYVATFLLGRIQRYRRHHRRSRADRRCAGNPRARKSKRALPQFVGEITAASTGFLGIQGGWQAFLQTGSQGAGGGSAPRPIVVQRLRCCGMSIRSCMSKSNAAVGRTFVHWAATWLARWGREAVMSQLRRTRIGPFDIATAIPPKPFAADNVPWQPASIIAWRWASSAACYRDARSGRATPQLWRPLRSADQCGRLCQRRGARRTRARRQLVRGAHTKQRGPLESEDDGRVIGVGVFGLKRFSMRKREGSLNDSCGGS